MWACGRALVSVDSEQSADQKFQDFPVPLENKVTKVRVDPHPVHGQSILSH
jgi:hypothetical protein